MKSLEQKILAEGTILPGEVLKVGSFLNQQIDTGFTMEMGAEIRRLFADKNINKILTIEASGIAIAFAAGVQMNVPIVFAKKHKSKNMSKDVYASVVFSYTHQRTFDVTIAKEYLSADDRVLIVDDFLAKGEAVRGLIDICNQAGATVCGACAAIEKVYQGGGNGLRDEGYTVESLAKIAAMSDDSITFAD